MDPNNCQGYPPYAPYPAGDDYPADYSGAPYPAEGYYPSADAPYADPYAAQYPSQPYNAGAYTPPPYTPAQYPADYADPYAAQPGAYEPDYAAPSGGYAPADYYPAADYPLAPYQDPYAAPPYAPPAYPYSGEYAAPPAADYAAYAPYAPVYQPQPPYAAPPVQPPYAPPLRAPGAPPYAPQPPATAQQTQEAAEPETTAPAAPPVERVDEALPLQTVKPRKKAVVLELTRDELKESEPEKTAAPEPSQHKTPLAPAASGVEAEATTGGEIEVEVETKPDGKVEVEVETAAGGEAEVEIETKPDGKVEVEVETTAEGETEVEVETKPDAVNSETEEPEASVFDEPLPEIEKTAAEPETSHSEPESEQPEPAPVETHSEAQEKLAPAPELPDEGSELFERLSLADMFAMGLGESPDISVLETSPDETEAEPKDESAPVFESFDVDFGEVDEPGFISFESEPESADEPDDADESDDAQTLEPEADPDAQPAETDEEDAEAHTDEQPDAKPEHVDVFGGFSDFEPKTILEPDADAFDSLELPSPPVVEEPDGDEETEVEIEAEPDGKLEVEIETAPGSDVEAEIETDDGKTEVEVETEPDGRLEVEVEAPADKKVEVEVETETDGRLEIEVDTEPEPEEPDKEDEHEPVVFESFDVFDDPNAEGAFNFTAPDGPSADEIVSVGAATSGEESDRAQQPDNAPFGEPSEQAPFGEIFDGDPTEEPPVFEAAEHNPAELTSDEPAAESDEGFDIFAQPLENPSAAYLNEPEADEDTPEEPVAFTGFDEPEAGEETPEEPVAFTGFDEPEAGEETPEEPVAFTGFDEPEAGEEAPEEPVAFTGFDEPEAGEEAPEEPVAFTGFDEPEAGEETPEEPVAFTDFDEPEAGEETPEEPEPEESTNESAQSKKDSDEDLFSAEAFEEFEPVETASFEPSDFTEGGESAVDPFGDVELPAPPVEEIFDAAAGDDFAATIVMPAPREEAEEPEFSAEDVSEALEELEDEGVFDELTEEPHEESEAEEDVFAEFGGFAETSAENETETAPAEDVFSASSFETLADNAPEQPAQAFEPGAAIPDLFSADADSFGEIALPDLPAAEDKAEDEPQDDFTEPTIDDDDFGGFGMAAEEAPVGADDAPAGFAVTIDDGDEVAAPEGFDGFGAFDDFAAEPDGSQFAASDEASDTPVAGNLFETSIMQIPLRSDDIDAISSTLDKELLARAYSQIYTDNNLLPEGDAPCLTVNDLKGKYYVARGEAEPSEMYKPVSMTLGTGCCCALVSDMPLAAYSLARDIAESYDDGGEDVSLAPDRDGKRREIIYLDGDRMLPDDLTSGEYLALAISPLTSDAAALKSEAATLLAQVGLGDMENESLRDLSHNKRMLILSLCAAVNPRVGALIINDSALNIEGVEENIAKRVFALLCTNGKSALLACCSPYLTGTVCNRVIALSGGDKIFDGTFHAFIDRYCLGVMSFTTPNPAETVSAINRDFENITALCKGQLVYLVKDGPGDVNINSLVDAAEALGAERSSIVMDEKTFEIACKEVFESV